MITFICDSTPHCKFNKIKDCSLGKYVNELLPWQPYLFSKGFSKGLFLYSKFAKKMSKRKQDEPSLDQGEPSTVRSSGRKRRKRSYGEDFEVEWSPPRFHQHEPTPQQPKATENKPGPVPDPDDPLDSGDPPEETVTFPSDEEHWKLPLPTNHRKRSSFSRKRSAVVRKRPS